MTTSAKSFARLWRGPCLLVLAGLVPPALAVGESVNICVEGKDESRKSFVTVEVRAAGRMKVHETSEEGCFSVEANAGKYLIRVREGRRRQDFTLRARPGKDIVFKVNW